MTMSDPVADMLTRLRNANTAKHDEVLIPSSKLKKAIAEILLNEGYIKTFEIVKEGEFDQIKIELKYAGKDKAQRVLTGLKKISKPGLRIHASAKDMPSVLGGLGIAIVSTNKGVITDKEARLQNVGGEVLAFVW